MVQPGESGAGPGIVRQGRVRRRGGGAQGRRRAAERLRQLSRPGIEPRYLQDGRPGSQRQAGHQRRSHAPYCRRIGPGGTHGLRSQRRRGTGAVAGHLQEFQRQGAEDAGHQARSLRHGHSGQRHDDRQSHCGRGSGQKGFPRLRSGQSEGPLRSGQRARAGQSESGFAVVLGGDGRRRKDGEAAGRFGRAGRGLLHRPARCRALLSTRPERGESGTAV